MFVYGMRRQVGSVAGTAAVRRRSALLTLGATALGADVTGRTGLAARDHARKQANNVRKSFRKRCNNQQVRCRAEFATDELILPCCEFCFTADFVACLIQFFD
jgi:hypothetical protein